MQNDVGIIRVDAQQLKAALLPSPTALLAQLGHLLPQAAGQLYSGFIDQVHNATFVLRASINSVEDYVHQLGFLEILKVLHLGCLQHMLQYHICLLKCRHLCLLCCISFHVVLLLLGEWFVTHVVYGEQSSQAVAEHLWQPL